MAVCVVYIAITGKFGGGLANVDASVQSWADLHLSES